MLSCSVVQLTPTDLKQTISLSSLPLFLLEEAEHHHLIMEGLPACKNSELSASIISALHLTGQWPLLMDPLGVATHWLRGKEPNAIFVSHGVSTAVPMSVVALLS